MREPPPIQRQTVLTGPSMPSFWTATANPDVNRLAAALVRFARECRATLPSLLAYVGALAVLAAAGINFLHQWPTATPGEPAARASWSLATHSRPAFAISQSDLVDKTETYQIVRHPEGGRKDSFRWTERDGRPGDPALAELEIYRPGGEFNPSGPAGAELAARMDPAGKAELEAAGFLDSKFGLVTLLRRQGGAADSRSCLGFIKQFDEPALRISGWSCQGDGVPAQRAAIGCMLSRLILLAAGNDPRLPELFAHAELRRGSCTSAARADWLTTAENPRLRGAF
jgi:hypothetical protein